MQYDEAARLRTEWGDKPCDHNRVEREYYLGVQTGDWICATCGEEFSSMDEVRRARHRRSERAQGEGTTEPTELT
jgi:hypothetical protein